jgi:sarcosine oxidase subunit beta
MGLSAAFHLRRADPGGRVVVLERAHIGSAASGASAAGVRVMGRDPAERALALASLARWPTLDRELEGATRYRRGGGLRIALDEEEWRAAPAWMEQQRADSVPVQLIDAAEARRLASGISPGCLGAVLCAVDGQAEAMPTTLAFAGAARKLGAELVEGVGATALVVERGRAVAVVRTDGARESCDGVVVAAGAWTPALLAPLGVRLPFETRALQMLLTEPASPASLAPVVSCFGRKLSFKQLADGAYLIGGGWPARIVDERANKWGVLEESVRGSLGVAREVYPALGSPSVARSWAGLEAFMPDELPVLGPLPHVDGVIVAAGFCGHGFALAPAVGDVLARLALRVDSRPHLWRGLRIDRVAVA